jgi:hypothetical protein
MTARDFFAFVPGFQSVLAIAALLFFALIYTLYDAIYASIGLHPSDVGLSYFDVLARSALAASVAAAVLVWFIGNSLRKSSLPSSVPESDAPTVAAIPTCPEVADAHPGKGLRPWQIVVVVILGLVSLCVSITLLWIMYGVVSKLPSTLESVARELWRSNIVSRQSDLKDGHPPAPIAFGPLVILDLRASVVDIRSVDDTMASPIFDARELTRESGTKERDGLG